MSDIWRFAPLMPFTETLSFLTDVQSALEAESRPSIRLGRNVYQMRHRLDNAGNLEAEGIFDARRPTTFRVPAWAEATEFSPVLPAGQTVLAVNPAGWRVGGQAYLSRPGQAGEAITIVAVGPGSITLASATTQPARFAMPLRVCKAMAPLTGSRMFQELSERQTSFVTQDNVDIAAHDMPTVDGLIVMNDAPVSARGTEQGMIHPVETIDEGPGGVEVLAQRDGVNHRLSIAFTDKGPAAVWRRRQFWHALRGRAAEFWLPSFVRDLRLAQGVAAGSLSLRLLGQGWSPAILVGQVLTLDDGLPRLHRKVTGVVVDGAEWVVSIAGSPGRAVRPDARVSIARRMRLDTDDIQLTHTVPAMGMMLSGAACIGVP